ncbi:IPT/TIG domain-containing protein [Microbacterium terrisoli]|uniref:IPT/TIG domain-containing protein n=1 Tax=Microbacterium terrisoli TaxID=3242192 RepID=UPI002805C1F6|nr:IPT/TIG domain-containing protein [Microbacterium protaetiae]
MGTSNATGRYLSGSLLDLDTDLVAAIGGVSASSTGTADQTQANPLNLSALGSTVTLNVPGGIQLPLQIGDIGAVSQYAQARSDGSSTGASGLISGSGGIGTGGDPTPGPLHLNLAQAVSSLSGTLATQAAQLANLDLMIGATTAIANQTAPAAASGDYRIADANLTFTSPVLANLTADIDTQVANVQNVVDGLAGSSGTLAGALGGLLNSLGLLTTTVSVGTSDLNAAVASLLTGTLSSPTYPGVTIDLSTGTVSVDLAQITALEGLAPNTDLLTDTVINAIGTRITGLVQELLTNVQTKLTQVTDALSVNASVSLLGANVVTIDSTISALRNGDLTGVSLGSVPLPGGLDQSGIVAALNAPLTAVGTAIGAVGTTVLAPVTSTLVPALKPVLNAVVTLTANNQSTSGGVFTETALRATVLPAANALQLNVANATVGPNALLATPVISSLTPTSGPTAGGTTVTITGTGFTGATAVDFGGAAATFTVVNDTQVTATTPAHAAGPVDVTVTTPGGTSGPGTFTFVAPPAAPVISSLTPTSGPTAGGTVVTITGTGFTGATAVAFGTDAAATFTVVSDTQVTATTPAHAAGPVDVTVTAPGGTSGPGTFTFVAPPAAPIIADLSPDQGPTAGGTTVTVTGTGFTGATGVTFDGAPGTSFTVDSDTQITVTTPAGSPGPADVVVQSPNGDSAPGTFTFVAPPAISTIVPDQGPTAGGTVVMITGVGLDAATGVTFDGVAGTALSVVAGVITVTTPAHAAGAVDVVVQSPNGDSAPGTFTYVAPPAAPVISSLTPTSGPTAGGTVVTITGTGFTGATGVTFDGAPGTSFTVDSDTQITVTTPAHAAGAVDVVVQSPNGDSAPGTFTYVAPPAAPVISSLTPTSGPTAGGTVVTITGTGFTGATAVAFGTDAAATFTVVSDTQITATTPAHAAGPVDVTVTAPGGTSGPGTFTFVAPPAISTIVPDQGPTAGGTVVMITGVGLDAATGVTFDGVAGTALSVVAGVITVTTPAHAAGAVDVVVQSPNGDSAPGTFTYVAPPAAPTIADLSPDQGPTAGGTTVTITGTGFTGATAVDFGGVAAGSFTVVSDTQITATTPAHAAGPVDVTVTAPGGTSGPGTFTFVAPPAISTIVPDQGPTAGGTVVMITGVGLDAATGVTFDGVAGTALSVVAGVITVTTPAHAAGAVDVVVQSPNGDSAPGTFTYVAPPAAPAVTGVDPDQGPTAGGTVVTITGTGLDAATGVTFDGEPGTDFSVTGGVITVTTPAGSAGPADVVVQLPNGDSAPGTFTYVAPSTAPGNGGSGNGGAGGSGVGAGGTGSVNAGGTLPVTGGDAGVAGGLGLVALMLTLAGAVLIIARRRSSIR